MARAPSLVRLCADFLLANPGRKFDARELAHSLLAAHPQHFERKRAEYEARYSGRSVTYQLEREIYARRQALVEADPAIAVDASDKMRFFVRPSEDSSTVTPAEDDEAEATTVPLVQLGDRDTHEADLYPTLQAFLYEVEGIVTKRIREATSSNRRGRNGNRWLHPDVVGMHAPGRDWDDLVRQCADNLPTRKARLISVEVKVRLTAADVRQHFFQTVSNSLWANRAYLAAVEIRGEDTWRELEMLCALHGVGYIRIDPDDPVNGRILIPAREREEVDWASANRIAVENSDFYDYLKLVLTYLQTGRLMPQLWDRATL